MVEKSDVTQHWPQLFDPFRQFGTRLADWFSPSTDAASDEKAYRIEMELPGVTENDIDVTVADGVVTVSGEKKSERSDKGDNWFFAERQYGSFRRAFRLPQDADEEGLKADLKDGVLVISVPRREPAQAQGRKVEIGRG